MTPLSQLFRGPGLTPLGRDSSPGVANRRDVAALTDEQKALLARHAAILAAVSRGEITESDPSVVAARQFFVTAFPAAASQAAQWITPADAEAILRKWGRW